MKNEINACFKMLSEAVNPLEKEYINIIYGNIWEFQFCTLNGCLFEVQQGKESIDEVINRFLMRIRHYKKTKNIYA